MKELFLYSFTSETSKEGDIKLEKTLVFFCPYKSLETRKSNIYNELRSYFHRNVLPDRIVVFCAYFNKSEIQNLFQFGSELYDYIPLFKLDEEESNVSIHSLQPSGDYKLAFGYPMEVDVLNEILNRGMVRIFNENGGLIVSQSAHHFVFPSGKHSDKFLRPGNVLLRGAQIQFLAFGIYTHFQGREYTNIYCDTSSINSLAYAYCNLMHDLNPDFKKSIHVESFGSYEGFESAKFAAPKESMFLISSSTSGNIIRRMVDDKRSIIENENICIVYGLDIEREFSDRVLCDLTINDKHNPEGIRSFESYNVKRGNLCKFCEDNSKPVEVKGDVFLLEKPTVNGLLIGKLDHSPRLKAFADYFKKGPCGESIIKCFYKENSQDAKKYEVYIDIEALLKHWTHRTSTHPFEVIFKKIEKYIQQNIPASLKYLIVLPDAASQIFADIIIEVANGYGVEIDKTKKISITDIASIDKTNTGSIGIVSSSVATGRNLLFISRALRIFEKTHRRFYFNLINRTSDSKHYEFLQSNLSIGEFGTGTHRIINVEQILCAHEAYDTPWHIEKEFLNILSEYFEETGSLSGIDKICMDRIQELDNSGSTNGLIDNLFFPSIKGKNLRIQQGFVFAPNQGTFIKESKQSDIYFIISTILNEIRSAGRLNQSEYVRNLLEPGNFVRYNDSIIQAALLRCAKSDELRYDLSEVFSLQMQAIIEDMINHIEDEHAEALPEIFYSIAIKKLRLTFFSLNSCISLIETKEELKNSVLLESLVKYIKAKVLGLQRASKPSKPIVKEEAE
jgi:hypothetical protein